MITDEQILADTKLMLNIKVRNYDEIYLEGYEIGSHNLTEATNPYKRNSREYQYWREGWNDAFYNEAPLFSEYASEEEAVVSVLPVLSQTRPSVYKMLVVLFEVMCVVFAAVAAYTIYDYME